MVTKALREITAWSFSRYRDHRTCPAFASYKYRHGISEPGSDAMQRGTMIHTLAENYVKGKIKVLPKELKNFEEEFGVLKTGKALAEGEWAFDRNWNPTSWFGKDAWVRIKIDCTFLGKDNILDVIDYKTGKNSPYKKPEYEEQLDLYGIGGLENFPSAASVRPLLYFIDAGEIEPVPPKLFTKKDAPKMKKAWDKKVIPLFKETKWRPKPGKQCSWCYFRKNNPAYPGGNGGPCEMEG